jgi:Ras-related C3 botulinum toxin substrate 1
MDEIKSVVVGDGTVGKTCLLISFTSDKYDDTYIPTIFDTYTVNIMVDGKPFNIGLWDTAGQEEYDRLRPLSYPSTDVFLICYSVTSRTSFNNVKHKWIPELEQYCPDGCARILVGTKVDLRPEKTTADNDRSQIDFVSIEEGEELARKSGLEGYFECSALTGGGVKNVFDNAIKASIAKRNQKMEDDRRKARRSVFINCSIM